MDEIVKTLSATCNKLVAKADRIGFHNLTLPQKSFVTALHAVGAIDNDGFEGYFAMYRIPLEESIDAFVQIGVDKVVSILQQCYPIFITFSQTADVETRQACFEDIKRLNEQFWDSHEEIKRHLIGYYEANKTELQDVA